MADTVNVDRNVVEQLKVKVADGCRILAKLGLADYLGHVSARVPGTNYVLIKARGVDLGNLLHMSPDRVVMVDLEANLIEGNYRAPGETKLHTEVYKARPDVMGLAHTHQLYTSVMGAAGKPILPMQGVMAVPATYPLPTYPSSLKVVTTEQGAEVGRVLGDAMGVHLKNHGILMVGSSVEEAVVNAIWIEHQAKLTFLATLIGNASPMSNEEAKLNLTQAEPMTGRWKYYLSLLED
ncbi:MAG TPA: class II aldolase/adducin family protein [Deltaproteobacteria bacterium]|nr:class II aldolase/adducin family protein [Deltaproteobacteria bacterium]HQI02156.1 class II aldolase/adducin family protein [Deltaproteobacteria bacterium]